MDGEGFIQKRFYHLPDGRIVGTEPPFLQDDFLFFVEFAEDWL